MKQATITKTSYTANDLGNSGEQFHISADTGDDFDYLRFDGQYGVEHRVKEALKAKGYKVRVIQPTTGRVTRKAVKGYLSEREVLDRINN